ncbi:hypothetical protein K027_4484, partial [Acinetobacter baumannii 45057_1]
RKIKQYTELFNKSIEEGYYPFSDKLIIALLDNLLISPFTLVSMPLASCIKKSTMASTLTLSLNSLK